MVSLFVAETKKPDLLPPTAAIVDKVGTNIVERVVENLGASFSLQLDNSTDVILNAQLVAFEIHDDVYDHKNVLLISGEENNRRGHLST